MLTKANQFAGHDQCKCLNLARFCESDSLAGSSLTPPPSLIPSASPMTSSSRAYPHSVYYHRSLTEESLQSDPRLPQSLW